MKFEDMFKKIFYWWAILFSLFHFITGYFTLTMMVQRTMHLAFALPLCYFLWLQKQKSKTLAWLIIPITIVSIYTGVYVFSTYTARAMLFGLPLLQKEIVIGIVYITTVIFICFISAGPIMTSLVVLSILYARFGNYIPGFFGHSGFSWNRIVTSLVYASSDGIFGSLVGASSTYIFLIILFGSFLFNCGADEFIIKITTNLVGHLRGGPAKMAIIASGFFGMLSGSALANVAVTGSVTIPLMKKTGYDADFAAAVETVASSGGGLMPPIMGMSAFIMAEILGVPYFNICKAAIIPALIYFSYLYFMVDLRARKKGLIGLKREYNVIPILKDGWYYILPVFIFIYSLAVLRVSLPRVSFYSILSIFFLINIVPKLRKDSIKLIFRGLEEGAHQAIPVIIIVVAAQIIISMLSLTALGLKFSSAAVRLSGDSLLLLLIIGMISSIILGMGLPIVACYIIVAVFVAPGLVKSGVLPIAAHLFSLYYADLSAITPPVAPAAFVAAGISQGNPMVTAINGVKLALPGLLVPFIFIYRPALLLLQGNLLTTLLVLIQVGLGIVMLGMAIEGYGSFNIGPLHLYMKIICIIFGILCFLPINYLNIIGSIGGIFFLCLLILKRKNNLKKPITEIC